ncbi:MAG TPA: ABC transporter substrate-binding protein, partial [Pyrodictium sp.]|nr:ABC transporter substrate-binding protein [Pyrodictium sp.]
MMSANARIEEGSALVRDDVINGNVMVGITIDFYGYTAEMLNPACKYIL